MVFQYQGEILGKRNLKVTLILEDANLRVRFWKEDIKPTVNVYLRRCNKRKLQHGVNHLKWMINASWNCLTNQLCKQPIKQKRIWFKYYNLTPVFWKGGPKIHESINTYRLYPSHFNHIKWGLLLEKHRDVAKLTMNNINIIASRRRKYVAHLLSNQINEVTGKSS